MRDGNPGEGVRAFLTKKESKNHGRIELSGRKQWNTALSVAALSGLLVVGCSKAERLPPGALAAASVQRLVSPKASGASAIANTLSREHTVEIDVAETDVDASFRRVVERCTGDPTHKCMVLQSDLSTGRTPSGSIKARVAPDAVEPLIAFALSLGHLQHRSTEVEDLGDAMQDTQTRIRMLTDYRQQLVGLQGKSATNIDAAIKIASELATVQSNLERATGEAADQAKRTNTDIVQITFNAAEHRAFWRPIHDATKEFSGNLSSGLGQAITAVAFILPWLLVIVPGLYLVRFLWRRRR